jgi:hypothetical protein
MRMVAQAAWAPIHRPLVREVVDGLGYRLGYADPQEYMGYHFLPLVYRWLAAEGMALYDLQSVWVSFLPLLPFPAI